MGSQKKLASSRQQSTMSNSGKRQGSNASLNKRYKSIFQSSSRQSSVSSASKFKSADKRKMICSLPRHPSVREQTSHSKPSVMKIFNSSSKASSKERSSFTSVEDEPSTQIPPSFTKQKVVNPGMNMLKSVQPYNPELAPTSLKQKQPSEESAKFTGIPQSELDTKKAVLDARFELIRKIDEGTYAKVYYAKDHKNGGREVVVKLLRSRAMSSSSERE